MRPKYYDKAVNRRAGMTIRPKNNIVTALLLNYFFYVGSPKESIFAQHAAKKDTQVYYSLPSTKVALSLSHLPLPVLTVFELHGS